MSSADMASGLGQARQNIRPQQVDTRCTLSSMGCEWSHLGATFQLQKLVRHLNEDHAQWFSTDWVQELYVQETVTKETRVAYCECGTF